MKPIRRLALLTACVLAAAVPAYADKGGNGHGNGHAGYNGDQAHYNTHDDNSDDDHGDRRGDDNGHRPGFDESDRAALRGYVARDYHRQCPPGLAKKHNGCQPPGQAKKYYRVGARLPSDVDYQPLPSAWRSHLHAAPAGYEYVRVDDDVLLVSDTDRMVIDAVTLLSALSQ